MNNNDKEEQKKFKASVNDFHSNNNIKKKYQCAYDQFKLYKLICRRGGYQAVTNRRQWQSIAQQLQTANVQEIKSYYLQYLFAYERKQYFGNEEEDDEPIILRANPRKLAKTESKQNKIRPEENFSLYSQLLKNIEEDYKEKQQFYMHKNKFAQSKAENKKIILGLQSFVDKKDAIYSLNMLLLYSVNTHFPFLLENNEKIFQALSAYTHTLYPPQNQQHKEHLRMVIAIFRNLTMNPTNLKFILGTPIFDLFVKVFNTRLDPECSKNIINIMIGLVKVGWNCNEILNELEEAIFDDKIQQIQNSLDLLRGLMDEKQEKMVTSVRERVEVFIKLLLSTEVNLQLKEQGLQILSFVSDVNPQSRIAFSKNSKLVGILVSILQHMRNQQKLSQFAALTLSNISTAPGAKEQLKFYESQLMQIGFTDDSLAGIMANILADIANN